MFVTDATDAFAGGRFNLRIEMQEEDGTRKRSNCLLTFYTISEENFDVVNLASVQI